MNFMFDPLARDSDQDVSVLKKHRRTEPVLFVILLFIMILIVGGYYWWFMVRPAAVSVTAVSEDANGADLSIAPAAQVTSNFEYALKLVPDALEKIKLASSTDPAQVALDAQKRSEYTTALQAATTTSDEGGVPDTPYALGADGLGVLTVVSNNENYHMIMQIHDELTAITRYYNGVLGESAPRTQGIGAEVKIPYTPATLTVRPSTHIVLALYFADVLSQISGKKDMAEVDSGVTTLIEQGVVSGMYKYSDIDTSRQLYKQYKHLLLINHPELQAVIGKE